LVIWVYFNPSDAVMTLNWIQEQGYYGNGLMVLLLILASFPTFLFLTLGLACGFLYGLLFGYLTLVFGVFLGTSISFLFFQKFGRNWAQSKIEKNNTLKILVREIEKHGFKILILIRFTPLPFGILNTICALTNVTFLKYVLATNLGLLFPNFVIVFTGTAAKSLLNLVTGKIKPSLLNQITLYAGLGLAVVLLIGMTIFGRSVLKRATKNQSNATEEVKI